MSIKRNYLLYYEDRPDVETIRKYDLIDPVEYDKIIILNAFPDAIITNLDGHFFFVNTDHCRGWLECDELAADDIYISTDHEPILKFTRKDEAEELITELEMKYKRRYN